MADWTYTDQATYAYTIESKPPTTLVTTLEDGKEQRREKPGVVLREFVEIHSVDAATAALMIVFWLAHRLLISFTKKTKDPNDPPNTETTVRFKEKLKFEWTAVNEYKATIRFLELG